MGQKDDAVILTADQILAANDLGEDLVDVPEWGGKVKVQGLSVKAINDATRRATVGGDTDPEKMTVQVVIAGMLEPKLTDDMAGALAEKSMVVMNRIGSAIFKLSGVDAETLAGVEARFRQGAE